MKPSICEECLKKETCKYYSNLKESPNAQIVGCMHIVREKKTK